MKFVMMMVMVTTMYVLTNSLLAGTRRAQVQETTAERGEKQ
jgi:hypothetical protein